MFFKWLKRMFIFIVLVLFRNKWSEGFRKRLTENCKKRRKLAILPVIREELDGVVYPSENCTVDTSFTCFNKDGFLFTARTHCTSDHQRVELLSLDFPGIGKYQSCKTSAPSGQPELKLDMVDPMRGWRIQYRGMLSDCSSRDPSDQTSDPLYVTVVLYWRANSDPFDHWSSAPSWTLSKTFDETPFTQVLEQMTIDNLVFYEQWGDVSGRVTIEGHPDIKVEGWKCSRSRIFEEQSMATPFDSLVTQYVYIEGEGTKIVSGVMLEGSLIQRKFGYLTFPIGERWATDTSYLMVNKDSNDTTVLNNQYTVSACNMPFCISKKQTKIGMKMNAFGEVSKTSFMLSSVNGKDAYGVAYMRIGRIGTQSIKPSSVKFEAIPARESFVDLEKGPYRNSQVGGKASNMSILQQKGYNIPNAVCIAIDAFNSHVGANKQLKDAIANIKTCYVSNQMKLSDSCQNAVNECLNMPLDTGFLTLLEEKLRQMFGDWYDTVSFAVRSSGASEDGQSASFAGQLETFLAISGVQHIGHAIKQCWASNLSYRVVEYRRQQGQPLVDGVGVIVQEMVASEVSGVLFTNDPLTGNPSKMVINASHGLGETVVSGEVTPDTIVIKRRENDQTLVVLDTHIGSKGKVISLQKDGLLEIKESELPYAQDKLCLNMTEIMKLCRLGIAIEDSLGQAQDIEWAIVDSEVYILQARPITSIEIETDEDMYQEFDTACLGDKDCLTLANVGEVLPGAISPLSISVLSSAFEIGFNYATSVATSTAQSAYTNQTGGIINNRLFINLTSYLEKIKMP